MFELIRSYNADTTLARRELAGAPHFCLCLVFKQCVPHGYPVSTLANLAIVILTVEVVIADGRKDIVDRPSKLRCKVLGEDCLAGSGRSVEQVKSSIFAI